jgi:hypothetical protein
MGRYNYFRHLTGVTILIIALALVAAGAYAVTLTAPTLTAPSDGATVALPVTLQWTAVDGANGYLFQLAKDAGFTQIIGGRPVTGTSAQINLLPAGAKVYWRAAATISGSPLGTILLGPWSAGQSFTVSGSPPPPGLTAPTLLTPANGSAVPPPVTLSWSAVTGANAYLVQLAQDSSFTKAVFSETVKGTSLLLPPPPVPLAGAATGTRLPSATTGTPLYWRVAALIVPPPWSMMPVRIGPWSDVWSFTVSVPPPPPPLTAPTLLTPANGLMVIPPVTFSWTAVNGATAYTLQFAKDKAFTQSVGGQMVTGTSVTIPCFPGGAPIYWRVAALRGPVLDPGGPPQPMTGALPIYILLGPWSDVWSFTTPVVDPPPPLTAPTLLTPANGSTVTLPVTFSWTAVTGATAYTIQFARDQAFKQPCGGQMVAGTSVTIPCFPIGLGVAQSGGGQSASGSPAMMPIFPIFPPGATIYWRVAALSGPALATPGGPPSGITNLPCILLGPWSDVWSFSTPATPPPLTAPTLITPPTGATVRPPITFSWTAVTGAAGYEIQFARDQAFTKFVCGQMVTGTSVQIAKFPVPVQDSDTGVTLYWRVAAVAPWPVVLPPGVGLASPPGSRGLPIGPSPMIAVRIGPWSAVSRFTVTGFVPPPPVLAAPTLLTPANGSTVTLPLTFSWTAVTGAAGYQIQFALDSTFSHVLVGLNESGTSLQIGGSAAGTMAPIGNQPAGITLYWRVRAVAAPSPVANPLPSAGPWSDVWSFTVGGPPPPTPLTAPVLTSPDSGATGATTSPLLQWDAVTGAAGYGVEVASDPAFTSRVFVGQTTAVQKQLSGLGAGSTYYWRVRAYAKGALGPWSEVWNFTTLSAGQGE